MDDYGDSACNSCYYCIGGRGYLIYMYHFSTYSYQKLCIEEAAVVYILLFNNFPHSNLVNEIYMMQYYQRQQGPSIEQQELGQIFLFNMHH